MENEILTYGEIKRRLKKPIDKKLLSHKKQGGADIAFLNITDLKDELDARLHPNHWEALIKSTTVCGDNFVMVVSLVIHASDGAFCQDGTGLESINLKGYGDTASNAFAQALRRAAESHGFCRELWRMELSNEQIEIQRDEAKPSLLERIRNAEKAIRELGGKDEPFILLKENTDEDLKEILASLTEQYKRLKATKEGK